MKPGRLVVRGLAHALLAGSDRRFEGAARESCMIDDANPTGAPSFIAVDSKHRIRAEYHSPLYKSALLVLETRTLAVTRVFRRRFAGIGASASQEG
jgi:hypothetical protein